MAATKGTPHGGSDAKRGETLIYGGRIQEEPMLGDPDLLPKGRRAAMSPVTSSPAPRRGPEDDVKTQTALCAVQLGLYTDIFTGGRKGLSAGRRLCLGHSRQEVLATISKALPRAKQ